LQLGSLGFGQPLVALLHESHVDGPMDAASYSAQARLKGDHVSAMKVTRMT
jgi:hypothetical protein